MERIDIIAKSDSPFEKTIDLGNVLGKRVISKNGMLVGRIRQLRMANNGLSVEGVFVSRGLFKSKIYITQHYIDRLTEDSIVLNTDPFPLLKGLPVVESEGEKIGTVKGFSRPNASNDLASITVKGFMRGTFEVPVSAIKSVGYSIILKPNYEPPKKHLWKRD